ncbi:hypothetical protein AMTRI_Chr03g146480 [Amborella trichopoda]|uniref:VQ domain-containing protein n=1 Tax=Amborella trichopoda TaxID=13333 RepID=W1NZT4_AMBTC|nr:VQ motif-containing protein 9 [Amborella trichopoda]ERN01168.1 hypothetical protein AMTR_s00002p00223990 [Amborella trichopoda]|eukprot:XP_020520228.1 VQ motif-containing protein 9 [Amborella trichopoda]
MENLNSSRDGINRNNRPSDSFLGINKQSHKIGKGVTRKSPIHPSGFANSKQQPPQPPVYNISKNDFRNLVQQLTGSPSQETQAPVPIQPPKPPSVRLQRIRPPPLRPPIHNPQTLNQNHPVFNNPNPGFPGKPLNSPLLATPSFSPLLPLTPGDAVWVNNFAESPVSAYMRYLMNPNSEPGARPSGSIQESSGLLPTPQVGPSPRSLPSPGFVLPSPTSQFFLPSPLPLPSPFALPSPNSSFANNGDPRFSFSSTPQSGILGPGPASPGFLLPPSPSSWFPIPSPRWRNL